MVLCDIPIEPGWHIYALHHHDKALTLWKLSPLQRTFGNCVDQQREGRERERKRAARHTYMVYICVLETPIIYWRWNTASTYSFDSFQYSLEHQTLSHTHLRIHTRISTHTQSIMLQMNIYPHEIRIDWSMRRSRCKINIRHQSKSRLAPNPMKAYRIHINGSLAFDFPICVWLVLFGGESGSACVEELRNVIGNISSKSIGRWSHLISIDPLYADESTQM